MGMDPITLGSLLEAVGGGGEAAIGALAGDDGHRRNSYAGTALDPTKIGLQANLVMRNLFNDIQSRPPRRLTSSIAQSVPGLSGVDPAVADPSLASTRPRRASLQFALPQSDLLQTGGVMVQPGQDRDAAARTLLRDALAQHTSPGLGGRSARAIINAQGRRNYGER